MPERMNVAEKRGQYVEGAGGKQWQSGEGAREAKDRADAVVREFERIVNVAYPHRDVMQESLMRELSARPMTVADVQAFVTEKRREIDAVLDKGEAAIEFDQTLFFTPSEKENDPEDDDEEAATEAMHRRHDAENQAIIDKFDSFRG
jgi:hypothetical protein